MLSAIRAFAKSPYAAVLIGLLIISFAVFGAHDMFRAKVGTDVITAGSRAVSPADFKKAFDDYKGQVEQRVGQQITPELAAENGLDRQVLQGLATREAFAALLTKIGLRPSDKQIAEEIQKIPAFFDQVTGRFDKQSYLRRLADNGLTAESFDARVRDGITEQQIATGLVAGLRAPRAYTALAAIYAAESRDMGYFTIEPQTVAQPPQPTDAQLTQFMKENATALTRPEFRQLKQRIALRCALRGFNLQDTAAYIDSRMARAGLPKQAIFPSELIDDIQFRTQGIPRLINAICDNLLLTAFAMESKTADLDRLGAVKKAIDRTGIAVASQCTRKAGTIVRRADGSGPYESGNGVRTRRT